MAFTVNSELDLAVSTRRVIVGTVSTSRRTNNRSGAPLNEEAVLFRSLANYCTKRSRPYRAIFVSSTSSKEVTFIIASSSFLLLALLPLLLLLVILRMLRPLVLNNMGPLCYGR